jgi:hypothetical protein
MPFSDDGGWEEQSTAGSIDSAGGDSAKGGTTSGSTAEVGFPDAPNPTANDGAPPPSRAVAAADDDGVAEAAPTAPFVLPPSESPNPYLRTRPYDVPTCRSQPSCRCTTVMDSRSWSCGLKKDDDGSRGGVEDEPPPNGLITSKPPNA